LSCCASPKCRQSTLLRLLDTSITARVHCGSASESASAWRRRLEFTARSLAAFSARADRSLKGPKGCCQVQPVRAVPALTYCGGKAAPATVTWLACLRRRAVAGWRQVMTESCPRHLPTQSAAIGRGRVKRADWVGCRRGNGSLARNDRRSAIFALSLVAVERRACG
jgi:hypothetical protein